MNPRHISFAASLVVALFWSEQTAAAETAVTGKALAQLIGGFNGAGQGFSASYGKDNHVTMKEGTETYDGTWKIRENTVCTSFKTLHNGAETCRKVISLGDGAYRFVRTDNGKAYVLIAQ